MESLRVAFLGPKASFSHQAAVEYFGASAELYPLLSFADAFAAVQQQEVDYAMIPVENSTNGSVVQTLDLLADRAGLYHNVKVCGEHYLTVHHCLLVRKNEFAPGTTNYSPITKLYTHPQAWGQCERFLSKHFKGVERQDASSTSRAAEIVSTEITERSAAIASRFAAEYHGMDILEANIEDKQGNTTRFLVLRNGQSERTARLPFELVKESSVPQQIMPEPAKKTLISFMVNQDSPGALADALLIFKAQGLNLTSINTRPSQKRPWQYVFFVECQRNSTDPNEDAVKQVLKGLHDVTESCRDLGTWKDRLGRNNE